MFLFPMVYLTTMVYNEMKYIPRISVIFVPHKICSAYY